MENGWSQESYSVKTEDGFVLQLFRIPGKLGENVVKKPAVLLQHGLECDMMFWMMNSAELAPAFILANQGYDVWLGNNRGTRFGAFHTTLDKKSEAFWDWDWEEMGLYDTPANIDFILEKTGQKQLTYMGHSQGTSQMFAGATLKPEYYKEKVNLFVALAPIAFMSNTTAKPFKWASKYWKLLQATTKKMGIYDVVAPGWAEDQAYETFCKVLGGFCEEYIKILMDLNPDVDNWSRMNVYNANAPAGAGYRTIVHYAQEIQSAHFARFDHGTKKNMELYGAYTPPDYDLSKFDVPTALILGSLDKLSNPADDSILKRVIADKVVFSQSYPLGHASFGIAKDMSWFSGDVVDVINKYKTNDSQALF